jgi:hypothetical protein
MATAKELATKLAKTFLANGRYSLAGERASLPVGAADVPELPLKDFQVFSGLEVHSVGYDPGEAASGDEEERKPTVYIYVVRGALRFLRSLPQSEGDVEIRAIPMGAMNVRPEASQKQQPNLFRRGARIACGSSCAPTGVNYSGTLGALVKNQAGEMYCLSNNHILGDCNHLPTGMPVTSPSNKDAGPNRPPVTIGSFARLVAMGSGNPQYVPPAKFDAALALVDKPNLLTSWQGGTDGYDTPATIAEAYPGIAVKKVGRTTGLTRGTIESFIPTAFAVPYRAEFFKATVWFTDVWTVRSAPGHAFAAPGDSGSLVVTDDDDAPAQAVGLLFAANPAGTYGWIIPIERVLTQLKVSLVSGHNLKP